MRTRADSPVNQVDNEVDDTRSDLLTACERAAQGAMSANTERALRADLAIFGAWCAEHGLQALPASAKTLATFVEAMAKGRAPATVRRYIASIATVHRAAGAKETTSHEPVRRALARMHQDKGRRQRQAEGLTWALDDDVEDDGEHFWLTFNQPNGATMAGGQGASTAQTVYGRIHNTETDTPVPANGLTASFANMPAEHGGGGENNRFTFDLAFSESPQAGYAKLRDHAFTITGGDVKKAQRKVRGSNQSWAITIEPDGWGNIALSLPGGRACTATGAICTDDNRQLAN